MQANALQINSFEQEVLGLKQLLQEKNSHLESLENKHKHYRDSLAHYRESVKTQREADLRKHDQQIQQMQMENRQLKQTISIKQTDITNLNRDNARLASELPSLEKSLRESETINASLKNKQEETNQEIQAIRIEARDSEAKTQQLQGKLNTSNHENKSLSDHLAKLKNESANAKLNILKTQAELDAKNELLSQLVNSASFTKTD